MVRTPDIVMTEIGDIVPAREGQAVIVRPALAADIAIEVVPRDFGRVEPADVLLRVIARSVAHDEEFEIVEALVEYRLDCRDDMPPPIVGRDNDRDLGLSRFRYHRGRDHCGG
jgi:hypothetical protein